MNLKERIEIIKSNVKSWKFWVKDLLLVGFAYFIFEMFAIFYNPTIGLIIATIVWLIFWRLFK